MFAGRDRQNLHAVGQLGGRILRAVDRQVDLVPRQRFFDLLDEQGLAADNRQGGSSMRSPVVLIRFSDTLSPGTRSRRRVCTHSACQTARGLPRLPMMSSRRACAMRLSSGQLLARTFLNGFGVPGAGAFIGGREQQEADHGHDQDHEEQQIEPKPFSPSVVIAAMRAIREVVPHARPSSLLCIGGS